MKTTAVAALVLACCVQLTLGAPPFTTKHWEIEPREKTTKHWEIQPRDQDPPTEPSEETTRHWEIQPRVVVSMVPYGADDDQDATGISMVPYVQTGDPFEGGAGTLPPGAVNDLGVQEISMVPYVQTGDAFEGGAGTLPPGAVNDGSVQEISMVPFGNLDGNDQEISMVPYVVSKVPFVPEGPWEGASGKAPPGALNEEGSGQIMSGAMFLLRAFGL
ncbi:unnamed protein product [Meganyctiphanes norvegica]|uniref:Uncharacterized protein n=1 Tax=Meganyctiphanes norvegica TaxID=48144 RepID=A0AAV2RX10_MEGNR